MAKYIYPQLFKWKFVIKYAVYSTLKSKSTVLHHRHIFNKKNLLSLPHHQLSPYRLNKSSHLMMEPGILLPLPCCGLVSPVFI